MGTPGRLWGWALQGDSGVGHFRETLGLGTPGRPGHSSEPLGLGTLRTPGRLWGWGPPESLVWALEDSSRTPELGTIGRLWGWGTPVQGGWALQEDSDIAHSL